jgi:hypothetical protein
MTSKQKRPPLLTSCRTDEQSTLARTKPSVVDALLLTLRPISIADPVATRHGRTKQRWSIRGVSQRHSDCGSGSLGGTDAMRGFAWRRRGFETLELCCGPTNTAIVRTTITASHHGCQRSRAARSWPTAAGRDEQQRVVWMRRPAMNCRGRVDENLRAGTKAAGIAPPLAFAARGVGLEPPCPAAAAARRNWSAARMFPPLVANPRRALTSSLAPGQCIEALAAFRPASTGKTRAGPLSGSPNVARRSKGVPLRLRPGAGRTALLQVRSGPLDALRGGRERRHRPRCLKRLGTSLEARGQRYSRAEKRYGRREPCAQATLAFRGRAFCRALFRKSPLQVNPRARALRFVGVA